MSQITTQDTNQIECTCCNTKAKKRNYNNRMKNIWEDIGKNSKTKVDQKDLDQLRFHFQSLFRGMNEHKYVSFGYMHEKKVGERGILRFWSFKIKDISDAVIKKILLLSQKHVVYISQNSFTRTRRLSEYAYASRCFILDLDYYTIEKYKNLTPEQMMDVLRLDGMFDVIKPSYAIASGHGLSLAFHFSNLLPVGLNSRVASLRMHLANHMIKAYEAYGADYSGKDLARINKIPGSTTHNRKKNEIQLNEQTRLVSHIAADQFTNSSDFLAAVNRNVDEWESFYGSLGFREKGEPLPANITYPASPECSWASEYTTEKVYILDIDQIKDKPLHTHSVDDLVAFYLPESKLEYLARLKAEDEKKKKKWDKKEPGDLKVRVTKTLQTLACLRVQDIFTLCFERAKLGLRQYRQSALFIVANMLAAQYDYHEENDPNGSLMANEIREVLLRLNKSFTEPYCELVVEKILNNLVNKFNQAIKEEQIIECKEEGKRDHRFYHFRTWQIIKEMHITSEEEKKMKVTISSDEKHSRYLARKQREKEARYEAKERKVMERLYKVKTYLKENKTVKQMAGLLTVSTRTIDRLKAILKEVSESVIDTFIEKLNRESKNESLDSNNSILKDRILAYDPNQVSLLDQILDIKNEYQEVYRPREGTSSAIKRKFWSPKNGIETA